MNDYITTQGQQIQYIELVARPELWPVVVAEVERLQAEITKIEIQSIRRHHEVFGRRHYEWPGVETCIDLLTAEALTLKAELAEAKKVIDKHTAALTEIAEGRGYPGTSRLREIASRKIAGAAQAAKEDGK